MDYRKLILRAVCLRSFTVWLVSCLFPGSRKHRLAYWPLLQGHCILQESILGRHVPDSELHNERLTHMSGVRLDLCKGEVIRLKAPESEEHFPSPVHSLMNQFSVLLPRWALNHLIVSLISPRAAELGFPDTPRFTMYETAFLRTFGRPTMPLKMKFDAIVEGRDGSLGSPGKDLSSGTSAWVLRPRCASKVGTWGQHWDSTWNLN